MFLGLFLAGCAGTPMAAPPPAAASPSDPAIPAVAVLPVAPTKPLGRLFDLSAAQLTTLLGAPDVRRREGPAEVWQYRAGACVLDLFLYEERGALRVAHAEIRSRVGPRSVAPCDEAVMVKHRGGALRPAAISPL